MVQSASFRAITLTWRFGAGAHADFFIPPDARYYLALVFGVILVISLATIYLAIRAGEAEDWVSHTLKVQTAANLLLSALERRESNQLSFLITNDDRDLKLAQTGRREDAVNAVKSGIGADLQNAIQAEIKAFCERERALLLDRQSTSAMLRIWLLVLTAR